MADRYWIGGTGDWSDTDHWSTESGGTLGAEGICDSYSETNRNSDTYINLQYFGNGQAFTGDGGLLTSAKWYIDKAGTPTGSVYAKVYAHSGTYGSSSVPTGSALATSEAVSIAGLSTSLRLDTFTFSGVNQITLENGTHYVVTIESADVTGTDKIYHGKDNSSPTHDGIGVWQDVDHSTWNTYTSNDLCFYVYTKHYVGGAAVPTSSDNVIIDENSGFSADGTITIDDDYSVNNITSNEIGDAFTIDIYGGKTFTIEGTPLLKGTSGKLITFNATESGGETQHNISCDLVRVECDYLDISNSNATGSADWYAGSNSVDTANNDGWLFEDFIPPAPIGETSYDGMRDKKYSVKIYDRAGTTFKGNYDPIGGYSFNKTINGGVGALSVTLPRKFDDYGLGDDVNLLDEIQVWVQDKDTTAKKMYSGYVAGITTVVSGKSQFVKLEVLGYVSRLGLTLDWDGTDISIVRNSMTPGEIAKDVIDSYRTNVSEERINYSATSVTATGTDISYTSNAKSCIQTIDRVREMAGSDWYWYVDADNIFYFKDYNATPDHKFVFGKDVSYLEVSRNADDIKNEFIFWNGLQPDDEHYLSTRYYNTSSIASYWNRFEQLTDSRITTSATADEMADAYINAYKDPNVSMIFEVKDNNLGEGYDIESIEPGDTCKILNIEDSNVVADNMVITSVSYEPEKAIVYVSDLREITGRSLTNLRRQLDTTVYGDRPADITSEEVT